MAFGDFTYDEMIAGILNYYDSGSDIWQRVNAGTATSAEIFNAFSYVPQLQTVRSASGSVLGLDYADPLQRMTTIDNADVIVEGINSNYKSSSYGNGNGFYGNIPANASYDGSGYSFTSGTEITGSTTSLATLADKASLAVTGVNIGCKLGVKIDEALYNIDPEWWDNNFPTINPQTWGSIAGQSDAGKWFMRTLFGVNTYGDITAYMSSEALAYTYMMLRELGILDTDGAGEAIYTGSTANFPYPSFTSVKLVKNFTIYNPNNGQTVLYELGPDVTGVLIPSNSAKTSYLVQEVCTTRGTVVTYKTTVISGPGAGTVNQYTGSSTLASTTYNGTPYSALSGPTVTASNIVNITGELNTDCPYLASNSNGARQTATLILDGTIYTPSPVDGITPGTIVAPSQTAPTGWGTPDPSVITGTTVDEVIQQLKTNYPWLFDGSITSNVLQDDGTINEDEYVPVPWPADQLTTSEQTTTGTATQTDFKIDEQTSTDILLEPGEPTNPPDTGTGNGPDFTVPTGNASSLWAVYHPSQSQLNSFGAWLWSSDFVEQIKRLFVDPMQAIIGVHKVFAPIPTGGNQNIKCGYLDSGVSSPTVSSQYTEVNCGTVDCREYFGNVLDYEPHTKISIYLPFIGVVPLKTSEVMRANVSVSYGVDVITGACLAKVSINRDGVGGILYSYGGSCACHYPISSGSYAGIISGIVTSAVGIAAGVATGNPLMAVGGAISGVKQMHADVQHSGGFTGCSGAMGPKKPYLIITRPQSYMADNIELFKGIPSNSYQKLGDCVGFVKVKAAHVKSILAYDSEISEIERLLFEGVIISDEGGIVND